MGRKSNEDRDGDSTSLGWRRLLEHASAGSLTEQHERSMASAMKDALSNDTSNVSIHQKFQHLGVSELNHILASLPFGTQEAELFIRALDAVFRLAPAEFAVAAVQAAVMDSLITDVIRSVADMNHPASHMAVRTLCTIIFQFQEATGDLDPVAAKSAVLEVIIGYIVYLSNAPALLYSDAGLSTARCCVTAAWALAQGSGPHCRAARQLCDSIGLAGRVLQLISLNPDEYFREAMELQGASGRTSLEEQYVSLLCSGASVCASFPLATRGISGTLSCTTAALRPLRQWMLARGRTAELKQPLVTLCDVLYEHRYQPHVETVTVGHVDGALRNLLVLLGMPLLHMNQSAEDITIVCHFALRYYYSLFQAGFLDVFKSMAKDVSYQGDYATFFKAFASIMVDALTAIGPTFASWGVEFDKQAAANGSSSSSFDDQWLLDAPGVDLETADVFISNQLQPLLSWGNRMLQLIEMSQRALLQSRILPNIISSSAGDPQQQAEAAALAESLGPIELTNSAAPADARRCLLCGKSDAGPGVRLLKCNQCKSALFCSRECQLASWPSHKQECRRIKEQREAAALQDGSSQQQGLA